MSEIKNLWNQSAVPHKGWVLVSVRDNENADATCEMCGKERIRYVHTVAHQADNMQLDVGCVCAEKMSDDYVNPRRRERELRNKATKLRQQKKKAAQVRQEKIDAIQRAVWRESRRGNAYLKVTVRDYACHLVIVKSKFGNSWAFSLNGKFSSYKYNSIDEAKEAARLTALKGVT